MGRLLASCSALVIGMFCLAMLSHVAARFILPSSEFRLEDYTAVAVYSFIGGLSFIVFIAIEEWPCSNEWEVTPNARIYFNDHVDQ